MNDPVSISIDRSMQVPHGSIIKTGWVDVFNCRMACRDRMAVGDLNEAYQRVIQQSGHALWPVPHGEWDGEEFVIQDGRHEYVAALMLGHTHILVAWIGDAQ